MLTYEQHFGNVLHMFRNALCTIIVPTIHFLPDSIAGQTCFQDKLSFLHDYEQHYYVRLACDTKLSILPLDVYCVSDQNCPNVNGGLIQNAYVVNDITNK